MFGFFDWIKIAGGVVIGAALISLPAYWRGEAAGKSIAAVNAVKAANKAYKDRSNENTAVDRLDAIGLCIELGGLPDDCRAGLRGMGEDTASSQNGGVSGGK